MNKSCIVVFVLAFTLFSYHTNAQTILTEGSHEIINNIEYGYVITNIQSKEDHERYEIKFYATNNSCTKYVPLRKSISFSEKQQNIIGEFSCTNATGKRFTTKGKILTMPDWNYTIQNDIDGKGLIGRTIPIGYYFRKDQTISATEIILTPKGEKPEVKIFAAIIPEF